MQNEQKSPTDFHRNILFEGYRPTRQPWIVPKLLRANSLAMLGAPPNSLKTWSALSLAFAAATGGNWMGYGPVAQSAVMLLLLDSSVGDSASQWRRLTQEYADRGPAERELLQDLVFRAGFTPGTLNLRKEEHLGLLIRTATEFKHKTRTWPGGVRPKQSNVERVDQYGNSSDYWLDANDDPDSAHFGVQIIIIDSLSKISDAKENAAEEMGVVMSNLRRLAEATNALVLFLHHDRKSGDPRYPTSSMDTARGSGVITAAPESYIAISPTSEIEPHVKYTVVKQRGVKLPPWTATLELEGDPDKDNEHALEVKDRIDKDQKEWDEEVSSDAEGRPEFTVESLYPSPWPYARARLVPLAGASPDIANLLGFICSLGGTASTEQCTTWVLDQGLITEKHTDTERHKAAKQWVTNHTRDARRGGWLLPASEGAKGIYVASARARNQYGEPSFVDIDQANIDTAAQASAAETAEE